MKVNIKNSLFTHSRQLWQLCDSWDVTTRNKVKVSKKQCKGLKQWSGARAPVFNLRNNENKVTQQIVFKMYTSQLHKCVEY